MPITLPTLIGSGQVAAGGNTVSLGINTAITAGSMVFICGGTNATSLPQTVTDTQNNFYFPVVSAGSGLSAYIYTSMISHPLSTSDTVTATYAATGAAKNIAGLVSTSVNNLDQTAGNRSTSANPSVTTSQLSMSSELCIAVETNGSAGGAISWTGGFSSLASMSAQPFTGVSALVVSSNSPVTASGTITSAAWTVVVATFYFQPVVPAGIFPLMAVHR